MVNLPLLLAEVAIQAEKDTLLERLDPQRRLAVVLALIGIGLVGALLIVLVLLGGRWARQNRAPRASRLTGEAKAKHQAAKVASIELRSGETLAEPPGDGETKA